MSDKRAQPLGGTPTRGDGSYSSRPLVTAVTHPAPR